MLLRQFDSVGVFLVALVLFCNDLLEPLCSLSATPLSTDAGLWPIKNSSPQLSHLSVPISWKPTVFSRLLFFIATAFIYRSKFLAAHVGSCQPGQAKRKLSSDARASPPFPRSF